MAGFFGLFNYTKEGPGVDPDEPQKGPVADFFSIVGSKFWKLVVINLMMLVFNLLAIAVSFFLSGWITQLFFPGFTPQNFLEMIQNLGLDFADGITAQDYASHLYTSSIFCFMFSFVGLQFFVVGPCQAGFTYLMRNYSRHEPVFLWMDFRDTALANWKQSLLHSLISGVLFVVLGIAHYFYSQVMAGDLLPMILRIVLTLILAIVAIMQFYIYQMMITFDLKLKDIYKNALLFTFLRLPSNFGVLLICVLLLLVLPLLLVWLMPNAASMLILVVLYGTILLSFTLLLVNYQANRAIMKYMIEPIQAKAKAAEATSYEPTYEPEEEEDEEEVPSEEKEKQPSGELPSGAPA